VLPERGGSADASAVSPGISSERCGGRRSA
jgi:hypothetical protein